LARVLLPLPLFLLSAQQINAFPSANIQPHLNPPTPPTPTTSLTYEARTASAQNPMGRACLELMARKRTNLCVAADVDTVEEMLDLADKVGPHICILKTHVDIFDKCVGGGGGVGLVFFLSGAGAWRKSGWEREGDW